MSYTFIAFSMVILSLLLDMFFLKVRLVTRRVFWVSYPIVLVFQLLTNWWLTSRNIVMYNSDTILGIRIASAPVEDLAFGFSLILSVLSIWVYQEKR
ncbi:MAG: lycopene cyclase domain-containing protein [Actinobacteria bacterium]|nr:lycopene cyclase domain-containing protein [Actinomycetota bacterium]